MPGEYRDLIVAPTHLRPTLQELIRGQARPDGRITMKMNSIVDARMIDELYAASAAGARIDLVVRGICCLRPGVPGLSENINVRSIVGRYLEHSRICRFGEPGDEGTEYIIGSADLMPRNLDRRVEAMLRVTEPRLRARLDEVLELNLADDVLAWTLELDGTWKRVPTVIGLESHVRFQELADRALESPHDRAMTALDQDASVADVIGVALAGSVERLVAHEDGMRRGGDPEDVHQARVATRRLRSDLRTFGDFVYEEWATSLRAELRWLGAELGEVRDAEVLLARLRADITQLPSPEQDAAERLVRRLVADWHGARDTHDRDARGLALRIAARPSRRGGRPTSVHDVGEPPRGRRAAAPRQSAVAEAAARGRRAR